LISNPWKFLCHSQFYVLHWHSSSLLYRFVVCFLVCHVCWRVTLASSTHGIITGYFSRVLICLSRMQKGTLYVQIRDKYRLLHGISHSIPFISPRGWYMNEGW
jgi:hypothetical protein